jgi:hypothetical protein
MHRPELDEIAHDHKHGGWASHPIDINGAVEDGQSLC